MDKKLYVDMDGTLARFHDVDRTFIEAMWQQGFYKNLKPFQSLLGGLQLFMERNKDVEVFILSAILDTDPPFIESEKRQWLNKNFSEIDDKHMIFTKAGENKAKYITVNEDTYLIDDYNKNLNDWKNSGGISIKFHNDVNHKGLGQYGGEKGPLWQGSIINHNDTYGQICMDLENILETSPIDKDYLNVGSIVEADIEITEMDEKTCLFTTEQKHIKGTIVDVLGHHAMFDNSQSPVYYNIDIGKGEIVTVDSSFFGNYAQIHSVIKYFDKYAKIRCLIRKKEDLNSFLIENKLSKQLVDCLETCYARYQTLPIARQDVITKWLVSSVNSGIWLSHPVTPESLNSFFSDINKRDFELQKLDFEINTVSEKKKYIEKKLFLPEYGETGNAVGKEILIKELMDTKERVQEAEDKWRDIAKADYPKVAFGNTSMNYKPYARISGINRIGVER